MYARIMVDNDTILIEFSSYERNRLTKFKQPPLLLFDRNK